jgi:ferritin-like metal-binding protein YciE
MSNTARRPPRKLDQEELRRFFISHLHRIYCAKSQLVEKLPELAKSSHFLDLDQAISETVDAVKNQLERIKAIYIKLDSFYQPESCIGLAGILDEAFQSIGGTEDSVSTKELSIIFYMVNIESIEKASFDTMMAIAGKMDEREIVQLLLESYDEAREDNLLFKEIMENYL